MMLAITSSSDCSHGRDSQARANRYIYYTYRAATRGRLGYEKNIRSHACIMTRQFVIPVPTLEDHHADVL